MVEDVESAINTSLKERCESKQPQRTFPCEAASGMTAYTWLPCPLHLDLHDAASEAESKLLAPVLANPFRPTGELETLVVWNEAPEEEVPVDNAIIDEVVVIEGELLVEVELTFEENPTLDDELGEVDVDKPFDIGEVALVEAFDVNELVVELFDELVEEDGKTSLVVVLLPNMLPVFEPVDFWLVVFDILVDEDETTSQSTV